jgi:hypothetical protein
MRVTAGGTSCDPTRLTGRSRQSTIQGHSALCDNEGMPGDNPLVESLVNLCTVVGQNALSYSDARVSQLHNAFAGVTRIYVNRADNNVSDSTLKYCIRAGSSAPSGGAWFQSDIKRSPRRNRRVEIAKTFNLSVRAPCFPMVTFRYNPIVNDQNRSDRGIRARPAEPLLCFF